MFPFACFPLYWWPFGYFPGWLTPPPDPYASGQLAGTWRCAPSTEPQDPPRLYKNAGDARTFGFDFGDIEEVVSGQTISTASLSGTGVQYGPVALTNYRVLALFYGGAAGSGDQTVTCTATLSGGGTVVRSGLLSIA